MGLTVNISTRLNVPGADVWRVLGDFGSHYQFNPLIKVSPITNGIESGLGAERRVTMYDGSQMVQRILEYQEGQYMLIGFIETDLPIVSGTARFSIDPPDQPHCVVRVEVNYQPKYGAIGKVLGYFYKPVIRYRYNLVIRGLRYFVSTKQQVGSDVS